MKTNFVMNNCFVFASNAIGHHVEGNAKAAYQKHGARWGKGYGHYGDSFAIPTKAVHGPLTLSTIKAYVEGFKAYAADHPELTFQVTRIGCGIGEYKNIAPLFLGSSLNVEFDSAWKSFLGAEFTYWGTHGH